MAIHINNGPNISASLTDVIGMSGDGTNWDFIDKSSISSITGVFVTAANLQDPAYPFTNKTMIRIERKDDHAPIKFELQQVANQATWIAGTAAALETAKEDISGWL